MIPLRTSLKGMHRFFLHDCYVLPLKRLNQAMNAGAFRARMRGINADVMMWLWLCFAIGNKLTLRRLPGPTRILKPVYRGKVSKVEFMMCSHQTD